MSFLETLNGVLTGALGPFGPLIVAGVLGVLMIVLTLVMMMNQPEDPLTKLKKSQAEPQKKKKTDKERLRSGGRNVQLEKFATFLEPKDVKELSDLQLKLQQAGYQSKDAVRLMHAAQMILAIGGLLLGVIYVNVIAAGQAFTTQDVAMYTLGPGLAGYFLPKYWVNKRSEERKAKITEGFPDALDMLLVCVEAGQSLDQSIVRVSKELRVAYPALADEFEVVSYEMKAGKDKASVLRDMSTRCGVQDVSSFVTVLIQSSSFGTSIGEALRVFASEMRDKRVMRAEEAANKLPTKMTLATMMLTVPPLLIILVGPSVVNISNMGQ